MHAGGEKSDHETTMNGHNDSTYLDGLDGVKELLATASRILADKDVCDSWGHISCRHPRCPAYFLLARSMPPALITPSDIICYAIDTCKPVLAKGEEERRPYKEIYIHSECYKKYR